MEFIFGLFSGGLGWELVKKTIDRIAKRYDEKHTDQRKMAQTDVKALADLVMPIFNLAITYYGAPSAAGADTASKIKRDLKTFASQWDAVNGQLERLKKPKAQNHFLISFRKSITSQIDEQRSLGLPLDTGLVQEMYRSVAGINGALMGLRYDLA